VLANRHEIPFTVAAPWSTVDLRTRSGADIPIEQRSRDEVARVGNTLMVPDGVGCRHPGFDITPAPLIDAIYTERGAVHPKVGERPDVLLG
jgi:methylthioribose-1-phosphate isomerase